MTAVYLRIFHSLERCFELNGRARLKYRCLHAVTSCGSFSRVMADAAPAAASRKDGEHVKSSGDISLRISMPFPLSSGANHEIPGHILTPGCAQTLNNSLI